MPDPDRPDRLLPDIGDDSDLADIASVLGDLPDEAFRHRLRRRLGGQQATGVEPEVARISGISYMHFPARNQRESAAFYHAVFGWNLRGDPDRPSFDDGTGHVIGRWVTHLPAAGQAGIVPYVYVRRVEDILDKVRTHGGEVVEWPYPEGNLSVATFRDPAGNVVGVWAEQGAPHGG